MRSRPLSAALAGVLVALVPAGAHAAAWLEPVALTDAVTAAPQVDTGSGGDAVAIWSVDSKIQVRVRAPGGGFGEVQTLSGGGSAPDVGVAADGTAIAAWLENDDVRVATRAPGAAFGPAENLPADGVNGTPSLLSVAINDAGEAVIAYLRGGPFAAIRPAGGTFGTPVALAASGCAPRAAVGPGAHAAVAWQASCAVSEIRVARRAPGEPFGAAGGVGEGGSAPAVTVEADGTTSVAYERTGAIRAASAPAAAGFGNPVTISADGPASEPAIASGAGEVWAIWRSAAGGTDRVAAARRPAGGSFGPVADPAPGGIAAGAPRLQGAQTGAMLAAWQRQAGDDMRVEAARREPGGAAFGAPALISAAPGAAVLGDLGGDGEGNAAAGYLHAAKPVIRVLDGAGPRLLNVDIRPAGFAKENYPFSFAPSDPWSPISASAFDFGDGTMAPGPATTHAFPEPAGPRTITISATDTAGNTSRAQRTFDVAPALDRTPPEISAVRLDNKRFRISTKPTPAYIARNPRGTRFRYTLSEPAAVTITFERLVPGRRKGKRCVRGRKKGKRCRISQPAGSIVRVHPVAGPVSVGFTGRVTATVGPLRVYDNTLLPGTYRVTLVAIDKLRNISKPVKASFTIVTR